MDAANSDNSSKHLEELERSCFGTDIDCSRLGYQLHLVHDAVRTALPKVRQVTLPSDDSRTTQEAGSCSDDPASWYLCIVTNQLRTHWTMFSLLGSRSGWSHATLPVPDGCFKLTYIPFPLFAIFLLGPISILLLYMLHQSQHSLAS